MPAGAAGTTQSNVLEEAPSRPQLQHDTSAAVIAKQQEQAMHELDSVRATAASRNAETNSLVTSARQVAYLCSGE